MSKRPITFYMPPELVEELRDAAVALGVATSMNAIAEDGIRRELTRLAKAHTGGARFPARQSAPKKGPRIR